jgi:hypothetical protein
MDFLFTLFVESIFGDEKLSQPIRPFAAHQFVTGPIDTKSLLSRLPTMILKKHYEVPTYTVRFAPDEDSRNFARN